MLVSASLQTEAVILEHEDFFDRIVPVFYDSFVIEGSALSPDSDAALHVNLPLDAPEDSEFSFALKGVYRQRDQQSDYTADLHAGAAFRIGTAANRLRVSIDEASYRSYRFERLGSRGFYQVEGRGWAELSGDPGFDLTLTASVGTGRLHDISHIALAQMLLTYTRIVYSREDIIPAAELLAQREMRLKLMSDDDSQLHLEYYRDLAGTLGMEDRIAEVILLDQNQSFAFERRRYEHIFYGSEISAGIRVHPSSAPDDPGLSLKAGPAVQAQLADLVCDHSLYYRIAAELSGGFSTAQQSGFIEASFTGDIRYFPRNYRWRIDGSVSGSAGYLQEFESAVSLSAGAHYLIDPNFTVFSEAGLYADENPALSLQAGISLRVW